MYGPVGDDVGYRFLLGGVFAGWNSWDCLWYDAWDPDIHGRERRRAGSAVHGIFNTFRGGISHCTGGVEADVVF